MQSKKGSIAEAIVNTFIGYLVTLLFSPLIYALAGVKLSAGKMNYIVVMFTILSVLRSYIIRRFFNKIILRAINKVSANKILSYPEISGHTDMVVNIRELPNGTKQYQTVLHKEWINYEHPLDIFSQKR